MLSDHRMTAAGKSGIWYQLVEEVRTKQNTAAMEIMHLAWACPSCVFLLYSAASNPRSRRGEAIRGVGPMNGAGVEIRNLAPACARSPNNAQVCA